MENDKVEIVEETKNEEKETRYTVGSLFPKVSSSMMLAQANIDNVTRAVTTFANPVIQSVIDRTSILSTMGSTLTNLALSYASNLSVLNNAVKSMLGFLGNIDYSPLWKIQSLIQGFDFYKYGKELDDIYLQELIKAKWFPVHITMVNAVFFADIMRVLDTTKLESKSRINKLDKVFFNYYNERNLNELKRYWKTRNIPSHIKRILCDAIQAYKRRQYALTVSALAPLWQGLIQNKAKGKEEGKRDDKTRAEFKELILENDCNSFVQYYFEEYIFYPCYSIDEVKDDVPGRNGVCHSWYKKYPSRKTALNAIIFTDFLLELEPIVKNEKAQ